MKPPEYDSIHKRGRALEEAFFQERDQHLMDLLRRRFTADEAKQVLSAATAVQDEIVIKELADVGAPQFLAVLGIFPMVEVAWCDGDVSANERAAIINAAQEMGIEEKSPSHQLLKRWLETKPADNAFSLWADYAKAICATLTPDTVGKLKTGVMGRARKIAEAAGGILGFGKKISPAEEACLEKLENVFGVR